MDKLQDHAHQSVQQRAKFEYKNTVQCKHRAVHMLPCCSKQNHRVRILAHVQRTYAKSFLLQVCRQTQADARQRENEGPTDRHAQ